MSDEFGTSVVASADCCVMTSAESLSPATQADLRCHYDNLQGLLLQFKSELLADQKQQIEQCLGFMKLHVSESGNSGNGASIPEAPVRKKPVRKPLTFSKSSLNTAELDVQQAFSEVSQEALDQVRDKSRQPSDQENGQSMIREVSMESDVEEEARDGTQSDTDGKLSRPPSARFQAGNIERTVHVEAQGSLQDQNLHRRVSGLLLGKTPLIIVIASSCAKKIRSPAFDAFCGLIICFNAILVGVETECLAQEGKVPKNVERLQFALNVWYMAELVLRIYAYNLNFFVGDNRNWNLFDTFLVASAIIELAVAQYIFQNMKTARMLRVVRLFRIVRTLRIIRSFKYVREFRKMVYSLMSSMQTLFWSLLLVFGVIYFYALWFTTAAAWYKADNENSQDAAIMADVQALSKYYSSLSRTIYTLFAGISGGYNWSFFVDPWISTGSWLSCVFFFVYISMAVFGLMNIVTSVFVESAMHATRHFQDLLVDAQKKEVEMYRYHMERIFRVIDKDGGGTISFKEMKIFLNDSASELPQYLEALGISSADVWVLFRLLDKDGSGQIDIAEFCDGCMRLKGEARSFDINCMIYESRAMIKNHASFMEFVEARFEHIGLQFETNMVDLDRRVSTGYCAIMSKLETDPRSSQIEQNIVELDRRVSTGYCAIMSKLEAGPRSSQISSLATPEARFSALELPPHLPSIQPFAAVPSAIVERI